MVELQNIIDNVKYQIEETEYFIRKTYLYLQVSGIQYTFVSFNELEIEDQAQKIIKRLSSEQFNYMISEIYSSPEYNPTSQLEIEMFNQILKDKS